MSLADRPASRAASVQAAASAQGAATLRPAPVGAVKPATPSRRRTRWMLGMMAICLLWPFPSFEQINNPNENVRFYMTAALVEDG